MPSDEISLGILNLVAGIGLGFQRRRLRLDAAGNSHTIQLFLFYSRRIFNLVGISFGLFRKITML